MITFNTLSSTRAWALDVTQDGNYLVAAHPFSSSVVAYKRTGDSYNLITMPSISAGNIKDVAFSPDGVYLAVIHSELPRVTVYKRSGDTFTALPASFYSANVLPTCVVWSPDGTHLAISYELYSAGSPTTADGIFVYKRTGDSFTQIFSFTGSGVPSVSSVAYSPDGLFMAAAVTSSTNAGLRLWSRSGDSYTVATAPGAPDGTNGSVAFSPDSQLIALGRAGGLDIFVKQSGAYVPQATLSSQQTTLCKFTTDGKALLSIQVPSGGTPAFQSYSITAGPVFTVLQQPDLSLSYVANSNFSTIYSPNSPVGIAIRNNEVFISQDSAPVIRAYSYYSDNRLPQGGYVNPAAPIAFSWRLKTDFPALFSETQAAAKLRWMVQGAGSYNEISISGSAQSYTMSGGTLPTSSLIEWQVAIQSASGAWSSDTGWILLTTTDSIPDAPTLVSPVNTYANVDESITFEWQHNIDTGTTQTKADLQYKTAVGTWTDLATINGSAETVVIPGGTLSAGQLQWRARTYNSAGVAGAWSAGSSFVGIGRPAAPSITGVTNASRPTITWQSSGQVAYRIQITQVGDVVYDTGEQAGTVKTTKVKEYLENGSYTIRVAVKNANMQWSDYSELTIVISAIGPETPSVTVTPIANGAHLVFSATGAAKLYLLRNGTPVYDVTGLSEYDDYSALGSTRYVLRSIDGNDNYSDSTEAFTNVSVAHGKLAAVDALGEMVSLVLTRGAPKRISGNTSRGVTLQNYAGIKLPKATFSGFKSESYAVPVAFLNNADRDVLTKLLDRNQTMLYRDSYGNRWYCVIASDDSEQDHIATGKTLPMTLVHYDEKIDYGA